ncbi:hypothetical protein [Pontibacter vulgaris]|uniref:hypothetical protein n=1 Tax=Pontibacter vulgaris TaxID=2905679 RepID=UPI001FA6E76D|nr:hypothetical protein [Pontibacter vulgaris]
MAKVISAQAFISLLNDPKRIGKIVEITDVFVDEEVELNNYNYTCSYAIVKNVEFSKNVIFNSVNLEYGIRFLNCRFDKVLALNKSVANGYDPELDKDHNFNSLIIDNCEVNRVQIYNKSEFGRGVSIRNSSSIKDLIVEQVLVREGGLEIDSSQLNGKFSIRSMVLNGLGQIRINNSEIDSHVICEALDVGSFSLIGNTFKDHVQLWKINSRSGLTFNNGIFNDDVLIRGCTIKDTLTIVGDQFKKSIKIDIEDTTNQLVGQVNDIYISAGKFGTSFIFNGSDKEVKKLHVDASQNLEGTIQFNQVSFQTVLFKSDNHKGNFVFSRCSFSNLTFESFTNYGNLIISSCKSNTNHETIFKIENSNLGKAQFFNFSLNSFKEINIVDSYLSDIVTSDVTWFSDTQLVTGSDDTQINKKKREIYRQFKQALEKQGDKLNALEFQALELIAFKKQIASDKQSKIRDRFILWLSQSNDFGLNWTKPVCIITAITFLFYLIIAIDTTEELRWLPSLNKEDILFTVNTLYNKLYLFPQLFNPARGINKIFHEGINLSTTIYFLDAIHRIILAFFIVQTVSAFRKFIK